MSHFSDPQNFRATAQKEIITTSLMAWKQCASLLILRQNKTGAFIVCDQMLFPISLQNICLSATQTIFKAAVQNGAVLDPRHQLPPSGKEYRNWLEKIETEREGWLLLRSQLSTQLPPSMLLQGHSIQYQTRARLNPLTHLKCSEDAWPSDHFFFFFTDLILFC